MPNFNTCIIAGHCGKDAETRTLGNGSSVTSFSVATSRTFGEKEETQWHNVIAWNSTPAAALKKGNGVTVTGRITYRKYQAKDGTERQVTEIVADSVAPFEKREGGPVSQPRQQAQKPKQQDAFEISDEDVPF